MRAANEPSEINAARVANGEIRAVAAAWDLDGPLPALCECADPHCTTVLRVTPRQYEAVRSDPRWFLSAPGHEGNVQAWAHVIEMNHGFVVVEKIGEAGEIAEALDQRHD